MSDIFTFLVTYTMLLLLAVSFLYFDGFLISNFQLSKLFYIFGFG